MTRTVVINTLDDENIEMTEEYIKQAKELIEEYKPKMTTRFEENQKVLIFVSQVQPYYPEEKKVA